MNGKDFAQDAADMLNAVRKAQGCHSPNRAGHYGIDAGFTLYADTLAELAAIKADMAEIDRIARVNDWKPSSNLARVMVADIAAKHRPVTDPLAEALRALPPEFAGCVDAASVLRAELAKRGLELARRGQGGGL